MLSLFSLSFHQCNFAEYIFLLAVNCSYHLYRLFAHAHSHIRTSSVLNMCVFKYRHNFTLPVGLFSLSMLVVISAVQFSFTVLSPVQCKNEEKKNITREKELLERCVIAVNIPHIQQTMIATIIKNDCWRYFRDIQFHIQIPCSHKCGVDVCVLHFPHSSCPFSFSLARR